MNTSQPETKTQEIDLIEVFNCIWKEKIIIALTTLLCLFIGSIYIYKTTPTYIISTSFSATTDLRNSIHLTKVWEQNISGEQHFSTPLLLKYADGETPYSPTGLFLRFSDALSSQKNRNRFIKEQNIPASKATIIKNFSIKYPKRLTNELTASLKIQATDSSQLVSAVDTMNKYLLWTKDSFHNQVISEISILTNSKTMQEIVSSDLITIIKPANLPANSIKPKTTLILSLSMILGVLFGSTLTLTKTIIRNRKQ